MMRIFMLIVLWVDHNIPVPDVSKVTSSKTEGLDQIYER